MDQNIYSILTSLKVMLLLQRVIIREQRYKKALPMLYQKYSVLKLFIITPLGSLSRTEINYLFKNLWSYGLFRTIEPKFMNVIFIFK